MSAPDDERFHPVASADDLRESGRDLVSVDGTPIALFHHEGEFRAVNNRCPHMGFPLTEGSVEDGVLTCHWHHARFELSCGDTFDPWADDVAAYPVAVHDGTVYVDPDPPREEPPAVHWADRLEDGLEQNLRLVLAKSAYGLLEADVDPTEPLETGVLFGTRYREGGWGRGLTTLTLLGNVLGDLRPADRKRALYQGLVAVAEDCADRPPKFDQDSFGDCDVSFDRLKAWFRQNVEVRDPDGAERVLRTAVAAGCSPAQLTELLTTAATDHHYLDSGHRLDFVTKATEALDDVGWDHAVDVLASLVRGLATAERAEERSAWRQPEDLAGLLADTFADLDDHVAAGAGEDWTEPEGFVDRVHDDDPEAVVGALTEAIRDGATVAELAGAVAYAAGERVARFDTGNEFSDWNTVHHTYTYANAVHQAAKRTDHDELYRGVYDAAVNVYLDRFLNMPPAPEPPTRSDADPDAALDALEEAFDTEGQVDRAARRVGVFLDSGGDPARLKRALGRCLVREDAGFHTFQALEAGFAQVAEHGAADPAAEPGPGRVTDRQRTLLVAVARYMAAHFPTRREREQTFSIAARLHRGERIHEAGDRDDDEAAAADD
ncbi:MAG: Rieske (2Fe-2S) protein [Halolamina sp.]